MKTKIGLVVSDFNHEITSVMEKYAEKTASSLGAEIIKKIHVPGAFEIPFAADKILKNKKADAIVVLGVIAEGETQHDLIIGNAISSKLIDMSLKSNIPIGFGVIGPRVTLNQAKERAKEYAERAVEAALYMAKIK